MGADGLVCAVGGRGGKTPPGAGDSQVPERKRTTLGLYVTALEAYRMWKAEPTSVKILDVRTPEEYLFVGHAAMARNIPLVFVKYQWDAEKDAPATEPNPEFIARVKQLFRPTDTLLVTCRSGGRSAVAVDALVKAGFQRVYNVLDGVEGDKVDDPASADHGKRMKNGWKNSGSPWTYDVDPNLIWTDPRS